MVKSQKLVVALLILSVVFSLTSVVFSVALFKMSVQETKFLYVPVSPSSNVGNIGLSVEGNSPNSGGNNG